MSGNLSQFLGLIIPWVAKKILSFTNPDGKIITESSRIRPEKSEVRRLCSNTKKIKKAAKGFDIQVVSPPKYCISVTATDYKQAEEIADEAVEKLEAQAEKQGVVFSEED